MTAQETFDQLLSEHMWPLLREQGFKRKGSTFGLRGNGVWGVVNFQKNRHSDPSQVSFTINVSVRSDFLAERDIRGIRAPSSDRKVPAEMDCDWRERIGFIMPDKEDRWWSLSAGSITESLLGELRCALIDFAIPWLRERRSDEAMLDADQHDGAKPSLDWAILMTKYRPEKFQMYAASVLDSSRGLPSYPFVRSVLLKYGYLDTSEPSGR